MAESLPDGLQSITPHLVVKGAAEAIEFYGRAFGAEEICRLPMPGPDGQMRLGHASLRIGGSQVFLCDEFPEYGSTGPQGGSSPVTIHLHVPDADAVFERAVEAGATVTMPLADMFWGDRYGKVVDPFGHHWSIAHRLETLTANQTREKMEAAMAGAPC